MGNKQKPFYAIRMKQYKHKYEKVNLSNLNFKRYEKMSLCIVLLYTMSFTKCKNNQNDIIKVNTEEFQIKQSSILVANEKNNHLLNLPELNYVNGKANHVFEGLYEEMHKKLLSYPIIFYIFTA